jgi:restriction system protein
MGAIWFDAETLADHLHEIIGYKAGVVATIPHLCDMLSGTGYPDVIMQSERSGIRLRSEDYEELYFSLLHQVGSTIERYHPIADLIRMTRHLEQMGGEGFASDILEIATTGMEEGARIALP